MNQLKEPNPGHPIEFVRNGETIGIIDSYKDALYIFNSIRSELMHSYPDVFNSVTFTLKQGEYVFKRC